MRFILIWIVLAAFWIGLSGYFDALHLAWGFVAVTLVSAVTAATPREGESVFAEAGKLVRLFLYVPWLLWQIVLANVDVMLRVLGVRPVEPRVVRFRPPVRSDFGKVALANSITLTPGTVTIDVEEDGTFLVHAIAEPAAEGLLDGRMAERVRRVEGQDA